MLHLNKIGPVHQQLAQLGKFLPKQVETPCQFKSRLEVSFLDMDTSPIYALMPEDHQMNSEEDFNMLENWGMTSGGRGKFSADFNGQSNETSAGKHFLQWGFSLTHASH